MKPCLKAWALGLKEWKMCEAGTCMLCDVTRAGRPLSDEQQVDLFYKFLKAAGPPTIPTDEELNMYAD